MDFDNIALTTAGFGLYCLALILKSTSLRHLRFARIVDLAQIHRMPQRYRAWMYVGSLALSIIMMGAALWYTINTDRSAFWMLGSLGAMLVAVRLLGFFFIRVSLIVIEIESDPASKLSLAHLCRSPFIRGGLALLIVCIAVPSVLDGKLQERFDAYSQEEWKAFEAEANGQGFKQNYVPHTLKMKEVAQSEAEFFPRVLLPGHRVVIWGRAGIGKTWFLTNLRYRFHDANPRTTVIFLKAKDIFQDPGSRDIKVPRHKPLAEDLLGHISNAAFGELAWGARPVTRQIMAQALILIDGLDELHSLTREDAINVINQIAQDKGFRDNILVVTTRSTDLTQFEGGGFVVAELPVLTERESLEALENSYRMAKLAEKLRIQIGRDHPMDERLRQFYHGPTPDWAHVSPEQTKRLYRAFIDSFGFSARTFDPDGGEVRMPFLITYRDLGIVEKLFFKFLTSKPDLTVRTHAQMRTELIEQFLYQRIEGNYQAAPTDPTFPQRVINALAQQCANYLRMAPHATMFRFPRGSFQYGFDGTTLDKVVLESELLFEESGSGRLVFDNSALDKYFLAQARRLGPPIAGHAAWP